MAYGTNPACMGLGSDAFLRPQSYLRRSRTAHSSTWRVVPAKTGFPQFPAHFDERFQIVLCVIGCIKPFWVYLVQQIRLSLLEQRRF